MAGDKPTTYTEVHQVPREILSALASVLTMPSWELDLKTGAPSEDWLAQQKERVAALAPGLLKPKSLLKKLEITLVNSSKKALLDDHPTALCDAHRQLNPLLMRDLFHHITREVSRHADLVRTHRRKHNEPLPTLVKEWCDRTLGATGLWTDSAIFRHIAGRKFPEALRLPCVHKLCEACIVAAIMGRRDMIVDVRAGMMSRWQLKAFIEEKEKIRRAEIEGKSTEDIMVKVRTPTVWKMVEAWTDMLGADEAALVRDESDILGDKIFRIRRENESMRRKAQQAYREKLGDGKGMTYSQYRDAQSYDPAPKPSSDYNRKGHPVPHARKAEKKHRVDKRSSRTPSSKDRESVMMSGALMPEREHGERLSTVEERSTTSEQHQDYAPQAAYYSPPGDLQPGEYPSSSPSPVQNGLPEMSVAEKYLDSLKDPSQRRAFRYDGFHDDEWYADQDVWNDDDDTPAPTWPRNNDPFGDENGVSDMSDDEQDLDRYTCRSAIPAGLSLNKNSGSDNDDADSYYSATVFTYDPDGGRERVSSPPPVPAIPSHFADYPGLLPGQSIPAPSSVYSQDDLPLAPPPASTPLHIRRQGVVFPRKLRATAETVFAESDDDEPTTPTPFHDPFAGRRKAMQAYEPSQISPRGSPTGASSYLRSQAGTEAAFGMRDLSLDDDDSTVLPDDSLSVVQGPQAHGMRELPTVKAKVRDNESGGSVVTAWGHLYQN